MLFEALDAEEFSAYRLLASEAKAGDGVVKARKIEFFNLARRLEERG